MIEKDLKDYPAVLNIKNLEEILGVSEYTARRIFHSEGFPKFDKSIVGTRLLIPKLGFIKWLEKQSVLGGIDNGS